MSFATGLLKWGDRIGGGLLARALGFVHFHSHSGPPFVEIVPERVERVLVIRPGGIGDLVLLLPAIRRLKQALPRVRVSLIAQRRNAPVAELCSLFDQVAAFDADPVRFWSVLRAGYDVVLDSEQFHYSSSVFALLSGAPARIGFKINPARNELYTHLVDYPMDLHESEVFDLLVSPLCGPASGPPSLKGVLDACRLRLPVPGVPEPAGRERVVVFPYGGGRGKEWPAGRWTQLVGRLLDSGREVALVGGSDARQLADEISASLPSGRQVLDLVGRLSLRDTAAVVGGARLYVGCDTGVSHLALALGTASIVLFGASDERKWGPPAGLGHSIVESVPCRPCAIFGYVKRCRTIDCMDRIGVERVWEAVTRELGSPAPSQP